MGGVGAMSNVTIDRELLGRCRARLHGLMQADLSTELEAILAQHEHITAALAAEVERLREHLEVAKSDELNAAVWAETEAIRHELWDAQRELAAPAHPAEQPGEVQGGGIPVSERLPSVAQEVVVNSEFDGVTAGFLDSYGEWYAPNSDYKLTRVVAWQPLPAAPALSASTGQEVEK